MADAAIEFLLQNVKDLFLYNAPLSGKAMSEVEVLRNELELLKGAIMDLSADEAPNYEQKALLNNVRKAVDKAEDTVDDFIIGQSKLHSSSKVGRMFHSFDYSASLPIIAREINIIRQAADKMIQRKDDEWKLPKRSNHSASGFTKIPVVEEEDVVGFDGEARIIIEYLSQDSLELDAIAIVGMAGLGKTTLANKVYKDERIDYEFIHRAWVYVSKEYRVEDVFISILRQLGDERESGYKMNSLELANEVMQCLRHKRYFIVLDDVWTPETWEELKVGFPNNKKGSRILVTTQNTLVGRRTNLNREPHYLKFLDRSDSWELLEKKVFGKAKCPEELRIYGESIAEICGGLPLTIVIISGILLAKRQIKSWWQEVAVRVNAFVLADQTQLFDVVAENYRNLPYNVQLCFLYCGLIPRGPFSVSKLIRLWIAEGFIRDELGLGLENVARACLDNLVDRSLLFAISRRPNGEIRTCEIHDLLRDFCRQEAEVQGIYHNINTSNVGLFSNYRRICVQAEALKLVLSNSFVDQIRTILTFSERKIISEAKVTSMLRALRKIRILEASCIKFLGFPKELRELVLLRYLAFSCDINSIPPSISYLWSLQTLIIVTSRSVIHFPKEIWKLYQLRHLETNASALLPEPPKSISEIGQANMQYLSKIAPESCTEEVFSRVPDVKKLGIQGELALTLEPGSKLIDNLGRIEQLTNLNLISDIASRSTVQNLSAKFSKVVARLTKLTLSGTSLGWESMSILGELEMLEVLKAKNNAFIGEQWNINQGIFPSLLLLSIDRTDLKTWEASNNQFQKLTILSLKNCDKLEAFPTFLADLPSFQHLDVYRCSTSVVNSAREIRRNGATWKLSIYPPDV